MRIKFIEAKTLTHGGSAQNAVAYKDGVPVPNCPVGVSDKNKPKPCVVWRLTSAAGGGRSRCSLTGAIRKGGSEPDLYFWPCDGSTLGLPSGDPKGRV